MRLTVTIARVALLAIVFGVVLSGAAQAQKTTARFDKSVSFENYKTYTFVNTTGARNPIVNETIVAAVVREFTAKGLTRVESNADLRVSYIAATGMDLQVASVPFYTVVNPVYSGMIGGASTTMWDVTNGTLVIDLWDNKTDRVVFRGSAKDMLERAPSADLIADAKSVEKKINNGIAKIFKKYPVKIK